MAFKLHPEGKTALKFGAVGCVGFLVDITVLRLCLHFGLSPFVGRAISLMTAMQATFLINGLVVFRCLDASWPRKWLAYVGSNGFGNLCNYLVFSALVLSRWPLLSHHGTALVIGSLMAYTLNFLFVRLLVFGRPREGARHLQAPS
jgi:putative flippase GtrA